MKYNEETGDMDLEFFIKFLEFTINIPDNHYLIAVFEDNDSNEIIGYVCAEEGVEDDYPVYSFEELIEKYGERSEADKFKLLNKMRGEENV